MTVKKKLSDEDMARVEQYLNSPVHRHSRAPFRPWLLLLVLTAVVIGLTVISVFYAWQHGLPTR
jgi:multisubunit Na+/H+ antiporter MnhC subunit